MDIALIHLLRLAHAAERAAAFAYRGHGNSRVVDATERAELRVIEAEEWLHRRHLDRLLARMDARPSRWLEVKYWCIGRTIGAACHLIGWFMPMYFAGRLEAGNVGEYDRLAALAADSPIADELPCIREMAAVEQRHEDYFLAKVSSHPWLPWFSRVFGWGSTASVPQSR